MGLTDRDAVERAMALCDELGRDEFLARFGYGRATKYPLVRDGREYDSKAIAGVAYSLQHGVTVTASDFSGGVQAALKALERLGVEVTQPGSRDAEARHEVARRVARWDADEMVLALHWYLRRRAETLDPGDPDVRMLRSILERRAALRGGTDAQRSRGAAEVAGQIDGFGPLDPKSGRHEAAEPSAMHAETWARYAKRKYSRDRKVQEILNELEIARRQATPTDMRQLAAAWGVEETRTGYRLRSKEAKAVAPALERTTTPEMLRWPYKGRRKLEPRTAAELAPENPELYDRANEAHENLRATLADFLLLRGLTISNPSTDARRRKVDFDLIADGEELQLVIEAKSMPASVTAEAGRLRLGLGQVLWYRHRFHAVCGERRVAVLVVECEPHDREDWLAACRSVGVVLTWPERFEWLLDECRYAQARG